MSIRSIENRLIALEEQDKGSSGITAVWQDNDETVEQAIRRRFNGQPPANTELIIGSWDDGAEVRP